MCHNKLLSLSICGCFSNEDGLCQFSLFDLTHDKVYILLCEPFKKKNTSPNRDLMKFYGEKVRHEMMRSEKSHDVSYMAFQKQ